MISADENCAFVYISEARKQLTELKSALVVASPDELVFNRQDPITVL